MNIIVDSHGISLCSDADVLEDLYLQIERETVGKIWNFEEIFFNNDFDIPGTSQI